MKKIRLNNTNEVIYYEKLDNGLDVYMCPKDNCESFYLTYNIKFGSMDTLVKVANEKKKVSFPQGTAHFLEHQLFQNENNKTAFEDFANLGSTVNAYTSYKLTCYEVMGSTKFKENLECLYKLVNTPIFQDKSIENEKKIITNEINMYDASPLAMLTFGLEYNLNIYDKHKYSISGTVSDIDKITSKILYKAYDTFYSKENSFMVIVGNFSHLEALGILKEIIKKYKNIIYKKYTIISRKEPLKVENKSTVKIMSVDKPKVNIAFKIDKRSLNKYSNLKIYLDMLLDIKFSNSSDFYEMVSLNHIIDDSFMYSSDIRDDYIKIEFQFSSKYIDEGITLIKDTFNEKELNLEDLERIKRVYIASYIKSFNDVVSIQESISSDIMDKNKINSNLIGDYEKINITLMKEIYNNINLTNETMYIVKAE